MKRGFSWGAGLVAGLSLLGGCERLWRSALTCTDGRSLATDDSGEPYCPGSDLGTTGDGGLGQWPVPPVPVAISALGTHLVTGLRVGNPLANLGMRSLNVFFEGQTAYATSVAGCDTTPLSASPTADFGGVIYDANSAEYGYTIYQSKPGTMSVKVSRSPGTAVNPFALAGATLPGFSFVDIDPSRRPIFSVINTEYSTIQWAYFDSATPAFGSSLPIPTTPASTGWHVAHADFNHDGYPDFVLSTSNAAGAAVLSGCLSTGAPCAQGGAQLLGTGSELLAVADFGEGLQLVRVFRGSTALLGLSRFGPAANQAPYTLTAATQSYRFPAGYEPRFVTAGSLDGGQTVGVFVAGLRVDEQLPTVFAFKLSSAGTLAAAPLELPLRGTPTAMAMGPYPCATKQQLVIAETVLGSSMISVYEPPSF